MAVDGSASQLGCGIVPGQPYNDGRPVVFADPDCREWVAWWRAGVDKTDPDLAVVVLGAWEVMDHQVDSWMLEAETDEYEAYLTLNLQNGIDALASNGARVVLLTSPCFRPQATAPNLSTSDRADDERISWFNDILADVAGRNDDVALVDLHGHVCPDGQFVKERDGEEMRTDGVHFSPVGAADIWAWLTPVLERLAAQPLG